MLSSRRLLSGLLVGIAAALLGAPALAAAPVAVSGQVTDPQSFLSSAQAQQVSRAVDQARGQGVALYVVAVPDLSGQAPIDWCLASLRRSSLSSNALIYLVAYQQRQVTWCADGDTGISDSQADAAVASAKQHLTSNPLTSADLAASAQAFAQSAGGAARPGGGGSSGGGGGLGGLGTVFWVGLAAIVLVGALMALGSARRTRRVGALDRSARARTREQQQQRVTLAGSRLLQADEIVRTATDEVQFAKAQFGELRTDEYARQLEASRRGVSAAFELQRQMEGAQSLEEKARIAERLLHELDRAMTPLADQQRRFHALRDQEATADQQVADVRTRIDEVREQIPTAQAQLDALASAYPNRAVHSLLDNTDQAASLLDSAAKAATDAQAALGSDRARALEHVAIARRAIDMALRQLQAITQARDNLAHAKESLNAGIASITADLNDVTRLHADAQAFAPLVADAHAAIDLARAARGGGGDPLAALEKLRDAEAALDAALAPLRSADQRRSRDAQRTAQRLSAAEALVAEARSLVQSKRGVVDLRTRADLDGAERALRDARAREQSDPAAALAQAERAEGAARAVIQRVGATLDQTRAVPRGPSWGDMLLWSVLLGSMGGGRGHDGGGWGSGWGGGFGGFGGGGGLGGRGGTSGFGGGGGFGGRGGTSGF